MNFFPSKEVFKSKPLVNFQFVLSNDIEAGEQALRVKNSGDQLHEIVIYKLKEGKTFEDFQAMLEMVMSEEDVPERMEEPADFVAATFLSPGIVNYVPQAFEHC